MSSSNAVRVTYVKETNYGVTPTAVAATVHVQKIVWTAKLKGTSGNDLTIAYANTATAGLETVSVVDGDIIVGIQSGTSTTTQILDAIEDDDEADALIGGVIDLGETATVQVTAAEVPFTTGVGNYSTSRFTSESLSGSPDTTESKQIRTDRMSSGQVVTGLKVGGNIAFELAKAQDIEDFMESAMLNTWDTSGSTKTRSLTVDATAKTITAVAGSFSDEGLVVGDIITLGGFTATENNVEVMITAVTSALVLAYAGPEGMVTSGAGTTTYIRADKLTIGTEIQSMSMEKCFTDLEELAINYKGMTAASMDLKVAYGSLISGSFGFSGNGYEAVDDEDNFLTAATEIDPAPTGDTLNGSVDMPFVGTDVTGSFATDSLCIQSLDVNLSNNLNPLTCIGRSAPESYTPGTAQIGISLSSYLKTSNWDMLARKLSQDSFAVGFQVKNSDGWYAFYIPAIQVSFDDPNSGGANQDISMSMKGQAKVADDGGSALVIYRPHA